MSFYNFNRTYIGKGEGNFLDVLPKRLTLQKVDWYENPTTYSFDTMFKEVKIKPYEKHPFIKDIKRIKPSSDKQWTKKIWNTLKDIIFREWKPEKFHVIAHSGGVDSRVLSTIIQELYKEHGRDWLGEVLFVENGGEADEFYQIMKHQKWSKKRYTSFDNYKNFHRLEPEIMVRKFNGTCGYPYNVLFDCYDTLINKGTIPKDFQGFAAYGCYVDLMFRVISPEMWFQRDYDYQFMNFNLDNWVFPWFHKDYILALARVLQVRQMQKVRVSDMMNPIPHIRNPKIKGEVTDRGFRHISEEQLHNCMVAYYESEHPLDFTPTREIKYDDWWGQYNEACILKHLKDKGYVIQDGLE